MLVITAVSAPLAAAAPETPTPPAPVRNDSATTTTTEQAGNRMVAQLSPATWVTDYSYENGKFRITIKSKMRTTLTVSEATRLEEGGAATFRIREYTIMPGTTTIVFRADRIDGIAAVTLTTPQSINLGRGAYIQVGDATGNPLADSKPSMAWLGGAGIAVLSFVAAATFVIRRERGEPKQQ